jgi:hypothetical protein
MIRNADVPNGLHGQAREYFLAYGTFPPEVSPIATADELEKQIEFRRNYAEKCKDPTQTELMLREMGYLARLHAQLLNQRNNQ